MPGPPATKVVVPSNLQAELQALSNRQTAPAALVRRATIVLLAVDGLANAEIARRISSDEKTVRRWRERFASMPKLDSLLDRPRSGRPPVICPTVRAKVISLACDRPPKSKVPFRLIWTRRSLGDAVEQATGIRLSVSEIGRILSARELRPHRVRPWLHCQDPAFDKKIGPICRVYLQPPEDTTVLCIDEKRLFAHKRPAELQPARPGEPGHVEFEYSRHGSSVLLAAFDIKTGKVFGDCRPRRTGADLVEYLELVAAQVDGKVIVIWDNLNVHYDGADQRWTRFNERHGGRFEFVYTPKHASWTNQVEIWFSILHRRVLKYGSFPSDEAVNEEVLGFIQHWNAEEAHPFKWSFRGTTKPNERGFIRNHGRTEDRVLGRVVAQEQAA